MQCTCSHHFTMFPPCLVINISTACSGFSWNFLQKLLRRFISIFHQSAAFVHQLWQCNYVIFWNLVTCICPSHTQLHSILSKMCRIFWNQSYRINTVVVKLLQLFQFSTRCGTFCMSFANATTFFSEVQCPNVFNLKRKCSSLLVQDQRCNCWEGTLFNTHIKHYSTHATQNDKHKAASCTATQKASP